MRPFAGFPARMEFTPVPNLFIKGLLAEMDDLAEVKVTLNLFTTIYRRRGRLKFATLRELEQDASLMAGLGSRPQERAAALRRGLELAVERGTILRVSMERDGQPEEVLLVNTAEGRRQADRLQRGELTLPELRPVAPPAPAELEPPPNIFALYEQNIGLLTPLIADELREAEQTYPESWIRDALAEAVNLNKRSWRYIRRILERWAAEGRSDKARRRPDPDKYIRGKYGHMVQR